MSKYGPKSALFGWSEVLFVPLWLHIWFLINIQVDFKQLRAITSGNITLFDAQTQALPVFSTPSVDLAETLSVPVWVAAEHCQC